MKIRLCRWIGMILVIGMLAACGGGSGNTTSSALLSIQAQLTTWQNKFTTAVPANDIVLSGLFDTGFLHDGSYKAAYLANISTAGVLPIGATFSVPVAVTPLDNGAVPNDATHQWFTTQLEGVPLTMLAIKDASGTWLLAGNQRKIGVDVVPFALQTNYPTAVSAIPSTITSGMMLGLKLNSIFTGSPDSTLLNMGVTLATVSGPGLIGASSVAVPGVTIFAASSGVSGSLLVSECPLSVLKSNCLDRSSDILGGNYTVTISGATPGPVSVPFNYTYNESVKATLPQRSNILYTSFPTITSVSPTVATSFVTSPNVSVSWKAPAFPLNPMAHYVSMKGWQNIPAMQLFYVNLPSSGTNINATTLPAVFPGVVTNFSAQVTFIDATGMSYSTINYY